MFDENSVCVKVWVKAVKSSEKELSDVPNLSNLVDVVTNIVEGVE